MAILDTEEFFTKKHNALWIIARACGVFAWIVLTIQILHGIVDILNNVAYLQNIGWSANLDGLSPFYHFVRNINLWSAVVSDFAQGIIQWLILHGISRGLFMVLETNLNFKGAKENLDYPYEVSSSDQQAQQPEFYNPQEVKKLQIWIRKSLPIAVISAFITGLYMAGMAVQVVTEFSPINTPPSAIAIGVGIFLGLIIFCVGAFMYWFEFGAIRHGLGMLMEMEFRSRETGKQRT
jgi:hypothetical protein